MCKECERERGGHENEIEFYESQICLSYGDFSNINSARRNALIIKTISTVINVLSFDGYKKPRRDGKQKKKNGNKFVSLDWFKMQKQLYFSSLWHYIVVLLLLCWWCPQCLWRIAWDDFIIFFFSMMAPILTIKNFCLQNSSTKINLIFLIF